MRRRAWLGVVACVACTPAGTAHAQPPPGGDVAVSYSFVRFIEDEGFNMPAGWLASFSGGLTPVLSVVGEAGGSYRSEQGETLQLHTFQGGIRLLPRNRATVRPYVQFLAGAGVFSCCGESDTEFSIEPGGGVDVPMSDRAAVRIGMGFPMVFPEGETVTMFRVHAGVVFNIGGR